MTTIITLIVLVSVGIVTVDGECQSNNGPIENCCCLGYNNNNYNVKSPEVYTIAYFCGVKCSNTRVYVILAQEEEDGLLFRGEKMEVLTLRTETG